MAKNKQDSSIDNTETLEEKLNTIRAGVLGANDGILTVVGVLFSVAVATTNNFTIFIAGLSDLLACAFSMASGEYASVSTQKDTEMSAVEQEKELIKTDYDGEVKAVEDYYVNEGVSQGTAHKIAHNLMEKHPLETVVDVKYGIKLGHYMDPWAAAISSFVAAAVGGFLPLIAMVLAPMNLKWQITIIAVCISVSLTGFLSAKLGHSDVRNSVVRNLIVGIVTMIIHYGIGLLL